MMLIAQCEEPIKQAIPPPDRQGADVASTKGPDNLGEISPGQGQSCNKGFNPTWSSIK